LPRLQNDKDINGSLVLHLNNGMKNMLTFLDFKTFPELHGVHHQFRMRKCEKLGHGNMIYNKNMKVALQ